MKKSSLAKKLIVLLTTFAMLLMMGCSITLVNINSPEIEYTEEELREQRIEEILSKMSLEEKVGQLLLPKIEQLKDDRLKVTKVDDEIISKVKKYKPCGVILFAPNIRNEEQLLALNADLAKLGDIPMFIAVDEEGGDVSRLNGKGLPGVTETPQMLEIGKTGDVEKAKELGATIGHYLSKYGFNIDFAPIADCFTNPMNVVIGPRSFGSDPKIVSKMVAADIEGLHSEGIPTCIKHYPGHGDTFTDTHRETTIVKKTWEELKSLEIIPFAENLKNTDMVMASHIVCTAIDPDIPTSLSHVMIQEKLRDELGYDGIVITDSMKMSAVSKKYKTEEAAVLCIKAGVDIILMPNSFEKAYNSLIAAVKAGELSEERIDESVRRILRVKDKYLHNQENLSKQN